jgi:hypothetical protein
MRATPGRSDRRLSIPLMVLAAVLGIVVGRASVSAADRPERPSRTTPVGPTGEAAVRAAIGYLDALRWDVLVDASTRRRVIAARATANAVAELDAQLAASSEALRGAVTRAPIVARIAVLGYRVKLLGSRSAEVRIWGMALFGTGAYPPATQWSTSDLRLVWSGGRWLVDGVRSRGGPSPASPLRTLARSDRSLREVRHAP